MITVLLPGETLSGAEAEITGAAYRHLFRSRRLRAGARLRTVDGRCTARWAEVVQVESKRAVLRLEESAPTGEPAVELRLLVAAPRLPRASWLVEKATELGAAAVRFLNTERAPRSFGTANLERLRRVAEAAVEQCHRTRVPEVRGMHAFAVVEELARGCPQRIFLDTISAGAETAAGPLPSSPPGPVSLAVGPEGGFSPTERQALLDAGWTPLHLGPRVLRVETAAVAGTAQLLLGRPWVGGGPGA